MRTLFLRIFLWFWLAMAVVVAILILGSPLFTRARPAVERWQRSTGEVLTHRAREISEVIGREGAAAFADGSWRDRRGGRDHRRQQVYLFSPDGRFVGGDEASAEVVTFATSATASFERLGSLYLALVSATDPDGVPYRVVVGYRRPPSLVDLLELRVLAPRLLALLLVAGLLTFWLAHYLTSPLATLRQATRRLSGGDLAARVGGRMVQRQDEIGDLARDFDAMADRIETLIGSQRRLVRDVSHELRSPLARLSVALELVRKHAGPEAQRSLDRIERETERLNDMVGQLLLLSRLESTVIKEHVVEFDLADIVREVAEDAEFEMGGRGGRTQVEATGPFLMHGNYLLLRSAIDNVIRNAVRHSPEGPEVEVRLNVSATSGEAVLTIRDHGPGVPPEALEALFEPFFRVDVARDRLTGGTGLGLAIASRAVMLHGGTMGASNHSDGGLVVTIALPGEAG